MRQLLFGVSESVLRTLLACGGAIVTNHSILFWRDVIELALDVLVVLRELYAWRRACR
jgi:hypothetical protein